MPTELLALSSPCILGPNQYGQYNSAQLYMQNRFLTSKEPYKQSGGFGFLQVFRVFRAFRVFRVFRAFRVFRV